MKVPPLDVGTCVVKIVGMKEGSPDRSGEVSRRSKGQATPALGRGRQIKKQDGFHSLKHTLTTRTPLSSTLKPAKRKKKTRIS